MPNDIIWEAREHAHETKGADWFWALGIVALASAVVALLFGNVLFALLIVVAAITMGMLAAKPPETTTITLTDRGIRIGTSLYPYKLLLAFWIAERESQHPLLILDAKRFLTPHIIIGLENVDMGAVHERLLKHLPEEELHEPFAQRVIEFFGF